MFGYNANTAKEVAAPCWGVRSLHAAASQCGAVDGLLRQGYDDKAHEMVLPQKRESKVHPEGHCRNESYRSPYSWNMDSYEYLDESGVCYQGTFSKIIQKE